MSGHAWIDALADWLVRTSWQSAVLVAVVAVAVSVLGTKIPARWRFAVWMLVAIRLVMPAAPSSRFSVFNLRWPRSNLTETSPPPATISGTNTRVTIGIISNASATPFPASIPASSQNPTPKPIDWRQILVLIWLAGAALGFGRLASATIRLRRRVRHDADLPDAPTLRLLDECRRELRLATAPPIAFTDAVAGPALFGFFRPTLLLPTKLVRDLSREELRFILLHELAHYRRRDSLTNAVLLLVEIVHWFNPLARLAVARCRAERELACDATAMSVANKSDAPEAYGRAVLRVAEAFGGIPRVALPVPSLPRPAATVGMFQTRSQLRRRITMIAAFNPTANRRRAVLPLLALLGVASCALTDGKSAATKPTPGVQTGARDTSEPSPTSVGAETINPRLQAAMQAVIPAVDFDGIALDKAIDFLSHAAGDLNVVTNWKVLESDGIDRQSPVTLRLRDVRFEKALRALLDQVGGDTVALDFDLNDNHVTISTKAALSKNTTVRVYDVREALMVPKDPVTVPELGKPVPIPDAPAKSDAQAQPATRPSDAEVKKLIALIEETVDPDSWTDNGGSVGRIAELGGALVITQTQSNHQRVVELFEKLTASYGPQIRVEGRYITIDPAKLPADLRDKLRGAAGQPSDSHAGDHSFNDAEVATLVKLVTKDRDSSMMTMPRIIVFNGQRGYVMVSSDTPFISGFKPAKPGAKPEPELSTISTGVIFDVSAKVTGEGKRQEVLLKLHPRVVKLERLESQPFQGPPGTPDGLMVQVPAMSTNSVDSTLIVPDGETTFVSGMMGSPGAKDDVKQEWSFLLVKPTVLSSSRRSE